MRTRTLSDGRSVKVRDNGGLKKRCGCPRRQWSKCAHPWHFGFQQNGREWRYSLDKIAVRRGEPKPRAKTEALAWADRLRNEIRSGCDLIVGPEPELPSTELTFGDISHRYFDEYVASGRHLRSRTAEQAAYHIDIPRRIEVPAAHGATLPLESKPFNEVTTLDIKTVQAARRPHGAVGCNRLIARLRHLFNWAIAEGIVDTSPFKRGGVAVVKLDHRSETKRTRRLQAGQSGKAGHLDEGGEEERLLRYASPHLRALIVAALSTGCRLGELLSLQWQQIRRDECGGAKWIILPASKTKAREERVIPISSDLRAVLEMRQTDPRGQEPPQDAYVFGNEVGEPIKSIKTAWRNTCRRAGIVDLRFHDLRREFACRLLESSADLHDVRDFLGHANITTTSRYLKSRPARLARALKQLESANVAQTSHKLEESEAQPPDQTPVIR